MSNSTNDKKPLDPRPEREHREDCLSLLISRDAIETSGIRQLLEMLTEEEDRYS